MASKRDTHPTIFVLEGTIRCYEDGTMLQLYSLVTTEEWEMIVEETIKYKLFVECLKEVGCPKLNEPWDEEDEWYRLQLGIAASRIRNIDPLLYAKHKQEEIKNKYIQQMESNAPEVIQLIENIKKENKEFIKNKYGIDDNGNTKISKL